MVNKIKKYVQNIIHNLTKHHTQNKCIFDIHTEHTVTGARPGDSMA
jgi:hypothetical protein